MFERYTDEARRIIFFARYEASSAGAPTIDPDHLLLGILRESPGLTKRLLNSTEISTRDLRGKIEGSMPPRRWVTSSVELPLADEAKQVLTYAHEESDALKHKHIGPEHLFLGLVKEGSSSGVKVLLEHGMNFEALRSEITQGKREDIIRLVWLEEFRSQAHRLSGLADKLAAEWVRTPRRARGSSARRALPTVLGLEKLLEEPKHLLGDARVGLICNQASVDHSFQHAADLLYQHPKIKLTALFGPQHGIRGDVQDNMIETEHAVDRETGLPIHSLYSETREPTESMLKDIDVFVFDMQDVGCRIYTFAYTMANCMRAAKKFGKKMVVCDRSNPINGVGVEGNILEPEQASFVGQFPIPTRHGMTLGELAQLFNTEFKIDCDLQVVKMQAWERHVWQDETDAPWVMPSPNMPTIDAATVFPGTVHFEGTQLSEGRGTTRPFELIGAPYIDAEAYAKRLNGFGFPGVIFRSCVFRPTFQKHANVSCGGAQIHVTDREVFEPVIVGIAMVKVAYDMYTADFAWKKPPYEYVYDRNPFDVIAGTTKIREAIEQGTSIEDIKESWNLGLREFGTLRSKYLLY